MDKSCLDEQVGRRRIFWTTQPAACGEYDLCGHPCGIPGLVYEDKEGPYVEPGTLPPSTGLRTIVNTDWLRSLILNILNTKARTTLKCPSPAAIYGHWSESYRTDNLYIGSQLWNVAAKSFSGRTNDIEKALQTAVTADMGKLTAMNVADKVEVEVKYLGRNSFGINIVATVLERQHVLNLAGNATSGTWVWQ